MEVVTPEQLELARALVDKPQWRWFAGMRVDCELGGATVYTVGRRARVCHTGGNTWPLDEHEPTSGRVPDLSDFSTAAILFRIACESGASIDIDPGSPPTAAYRDADGDWQREADLGVCAAKAILEAWK
jgi:hypothetical protein